VLRHLSSIWLECEDAQGIFYYNQSTKQSTDVFPSDAVAAPAMPQAMAPQPAAAPAYQQAATPQASQAVVKREIGIWKICADEKGEFYFNSQTNQSYDEPPPELKQMMQGLHQPSAPASGLPPSYSQKPAVQQSPPAAAPSTVKAQVGAWAICQDAQGEFYFNSETKQSFDQAPPELLRILQQQKQAQQPLPQQPQPQPQGSYVSYAGGVPQQQQPKAQSPPVGAQSTVKAQFGVWAVCQDAQGEFYFNSETQQSFDQAPPELLRILQQQPKQAQPQSYAGGLPQY